MAFPPRLLNEGEQVVVDLRPHWWFLSGPVAALVGAVVLAIFVQASVHDPPGALTLASLVVVLVPLVWAAARYARWRTTNFVVTTDRLIYRHGVLAKHGREIPLERVNDITFGQTMFERMIGAGDLLIESGGERGQQQFHDIRRPAFVQNEIYRMIEANKVRDAERLMGRREPSVLDQIEKLEELRQRGVISQAEFDAKKAQLLDRL